MKHLAGAAAIFAAAPCFLKRAFKSPFPKGDEQIKNASSFGRVRIFIQSVSMETRQGCIVPQEYFGIRKRRSI